ncbi:uncharacterized protein STEHIDRAFT_151034 [Stereum hirsutum FP-91666 SS1]|uniref:Uncharacterized protein n=1 Tax=Stereum hirsutum (strain FP-91666) TaxID=721885 RepID=R7RWQ2_STEHR|nr:uncharacterized protein STEHIDRAFT_151034 [Stereum hirsutum FP-91666 SS1]EIM79250.1 hypothetical protein STEHIDRAFT_151034 [Stereum hirsutum FP-91666 SS1]
MLGMFSRPAAILTRPDCKSGRSSANPPEIAHCLAIQIAPTAPSSLSYASPFAPWIVRPFPLLQALSGGHLMIRHALCARVWIWPWTATCSLQSSVILPTALPDILLEDIDDYLVSPPPPAVFSGEHDLHGGTPLRARSIPLDSWDVPVGLSFAESGHASLPSPSSGQSSRLPLPPPPPTSSRPMLPPIQSMFTQPQLGCEERGQNVQPVNTFHSNTMATGPPRVQEFQVTPSESVAGAKLKYNTRRSGRHKILSDFLRRIRANRLVL